VKRKKSSGKEGDPAWEDHRAEAHGITLSYGRPSPWQGFIYENKDYRENTQKTDREAPEEKKMGP